MVEFRYDEASGRAVLLEVNGRFWGSLPLAVHAGCDFPYEFYRSSVEPDRPAAVTAYRTGVQCRLLAAETKWLLQALRQQPIPRWRAVAQYLLAFRPGTRYYVWAWDDPRPAVTTFLSRWSRLAGAIRRRRRRG